MDFIVMWGAVIMPGYDALLESGILWAKIGSHNRTAAATNYINPFLTSKLL